MSHWLQRGIAVVAACTLLAAGPTLAAEPNPPPQPEDTTEAQPPDASAGDDRPADDGAAMDERIDDAVAQAVAEAFPVRASYGNKGFRLESRDGNYQTNLQWRFQFRFTNPYRSDPRSVGDFDAADQSTFELRRVRMKIGGHGHRPWLKYYFEVDLQPTRDTSDPSADASARVIDWRVDVARFDPIGLRVGQWKIDYNRERVDSSGRQQFVERSIVNRTFTIDRQVGVSLRGHLFEGTPADLRYAFGAFTGEGRGVQNDDNNLMYAGRLQWNFLGRDLALRQTDVERTDKPTGSLAVGGATNRGVCTRWSSSGCGNLDGFAGPGDEPGDAVAGQFRTHQAVGEFAFKWRGLSLQNEWHWKRVLDDNRRDGTPPRESNLYGVYAQGGVFFSEIIDSIPEQLEVAFRYAMVREPNRDDVTIDNERQEFTPALNWFFAGHNNKLTLDYSYLTLVDEVNDREPSDHRVRLQWDVSF